MSETGEAAEQTSPLEEIKSLEDLGEKVAESNPKLWGPEGEFSIFKTKKGNDGKPTYLTEEKDGETKKVIDQINFMKWTSMQLAEYPNPYAAKNENSNEKRTNMLTRLFRRKTQPPITQMTRMHYGNWTGHAEDMVKFTTYDSKTGLKFKREEYKKYMDEKVSQATKIKLALAA